MDVNVEEDADVTKITLTDANPAVANALRRSILTKVPTLSISHLDISENQSAIFDEMLAHRAGLVPFTIPQTVEDGDTVHIAAMKEGPGKLYAKDIKTDNEEAEPVNPDTVIATLKEGQAVEFEGQAELGRGEEHAKHQGGTVGYEKIDDGEFVFRIESSSGYSNEELFEQAVKEIKKELDEFSEALEEL
ncbi:hypothetical protein [Candidatus Nanohalococcus occultus]|uniref:DNA-directed RNA polymerase subunit Rpo3 n=1 Tax=Candidatus Nanohalococcus occultus TaxID=2978047 RepID=A0ABY8CFE5_9ARCH|nr:DNA-directed RNA polymerase subunit D [Candidatus Nanohaloarchaeota archaeon SVXNc]